MAFEQLMAEATAKREKKSDKPDKEAAEKEKKRHRWHSHGHDAGLEGEKA